MSRPPSFDPGFSTDDLSRIYSAQTAVEAMLEFEAALALALADAGIAPLSEAEEVASACRLGVDDAEAIIASTWTSGTPLLALQDEIGSRIANDEARHWFHHGATSQDAIDTATMIQARAALDVLTQGLVSIASNLRDLTLAHRDRPHRGRTFLQGATLTTFGFRTATWLDAVLGHIEDAHAQRGSLVVQLGGPVGTLEAFGDRGTAVVTALASRLGLQVPDIAWHSNRVRIWSLAQSVGRIAQSMAKIGSDIALLASTGISEVKVRTGGSSSMPGKQNPVDPIRAVAAAAACSGALAMLASAPPHELDRGMGGWHTEWLAVPLVFHTTAAAVEAIEICMGSLEVVPETMGSHVTEEGIEHSPAQIDRVLKTYDDLIG